jgi:hypothetical protein
MEDAMEDLATGLVAAFVGGFAGFLTSVVSNLFERRKEIDQSVRDARLRVYESLWHKFGFIPRWPRGSVTPLQLQQFSASLRDWYFGAAPDTALAMGAMDDPTSTPGGMYLSTKSRERYNNFQDAIQPIATATDDDRLADSPISDELYDELQRLVSELRTEITEDLLSRRRQFLTR